MEIFTLLETIEDIIEKSKKIPFSGKALVNNTRYNKVHRQTVYLANRGAQEFYGEGFVMGNNANKYNAKPTEKFPGAFVSDPLLVSDYSRMKINWYPINLFNNMDDFDLYKVA